MTTAILTSQRDAGAGTVLVGLKVPPEVLRQYVAPGQYVEVRGGKANASGYFVLASEVGHDPLELLVRNAGGAAEALITAARGTEFDLSGPLGKGFPMDRARSRTLLVAVAGTALSVARPILSRRMADGEAAGTHVFLGVRSVRDVALPSEVDRWAAAGARVVLCLSRAAVHHDPELLPHAERAVGYVQSVLERDPGLRGSVVFGAGPEPMLEALRDIGKRVGPSVDVVTNV